MKFTHLGWAGWALLSMLLSGCNPSSGDGDGGSATTYTINDPNWSAGADTWASIAIPYFDTKASIFALVRNDTTNVQRLLSGQRGDKTFSSTQLATDAKYNDIAAVRITQSKDGESKTDYAMVGCAQDGSLELFLASDPNNIYTTKPTSAVSCASVAVDPVNYSDGDDVQIRFAYNSGSAVVSKLTFDVDLFYSTEASIGTANAFSSSSWVGESVGSSDYSMRAIESLFVTEVTAIPLYAMQSTSSNEISAKRSFSTTWSYYNSAINPFTAATEPFDMTDMILAPDHGLYMVGEKPGLIGNRHSEVYGLDGRTKKLSGDGDRCIDALAWDGTDLWCHDSTSEGRLIRFSPPNISD
ncbi:hypothetical protein [Saccharospirillum mangrovi]|uniref:hypothetical protein n=1 Tax=Saccharospirillum mangrovi TaxID=2161747 RepID=UPI000D38C7B3|nr:hypothetical protein [Saccharospirillum mangrovi]